ncbi:conserved hypothetical protein (plasmid) [Bacillus anthracis str. A0488]|uniref:Uncharacterized protein n=1 Tax=Bacillus anthracis TaxID=1392 RepID=Q6EZH6_BACAN|nr:hypothetical protein BX_A0215 [Bacillus anthracis str. A2012]AAT35504.1 conserved hypothetical protein [Bacillus anthracis str. 'Ames Ancestor']ADK08236.1 hypothetical protein BACI_pCIXO102010 [Bacillus cereus biovar anthracis str. CI]EDR16381.1 conserved hypothetical protein [Bacillus anthracis str. A0488]EDR85283.1 conserved hypothetical protein [Bacillus anthracis str. A0193]EDS94375.1 conserved hypothetical protein [Bacillus anthracis str. A0389]EDT17086.1 conserved hypothetical protei
MKLGKRLAHRKIMAKFKQTNRYLEVSLNNDCICI